MKVISSTLKPIIERWDDPGDYPSGAGAGPLASYDYVEYVDGSVVVELGPEDWKSVVDYADLGMTTAKMVEAWLKDDPGMVEHGESWLTVKSWILENMLGDRAILTVDDFKATAPDYEPDDEPDDEPRYYGSDPEEQE